MTAQELFPDEAKAKPQSLLAFFKENNLDEGFAERLGQLADSFGLVQTDNADRVLLGCFLNYLKEARKHLGRMEVVALSRLGVILNEIGRR